MKYIGLSLFLSLFLIGCGSKEAPPEQPQEKMDMQATSMAVDGERVIYYTCPMEEHKHVHSKEPGTCTECNMQLVAGVVTSEENMAYYGCPMLIHSHIRHSEPGRCEECRMELKPMRLKKVES